MVSRVTMLSPISTGPLIAHRYPRTSHPCTALVRDVQLQQTLTGLVVNAAGRTSRRTGCRDGALRRTYPRLISTTIARSQ